MKNKSPDKKEKGVKEITQIYDLMVKENLTELNWEKDKFRIQIKRKSKRDKTALRDSSLEPNQGVENLQKEEYKQDAAVEQKGTVQIKSPMAGIFYRSPSPGAPPFIKEGDTASAGQTVCLIEAMKSMNEISAEQECKIVKILVSDNENIEAGQPIIVILPL